MERISATSRESIKNFASPYNFETAAAAASRERFLAATELVTRAKHHCRALDRRTTLLLLRD
jgi:hypothetical protein